MRAVIAYLALAFAHAHAAAEPNSLEASVRAVFVYKFLPFVQWPRASMGSAGDPIRVCIANDPSFAALVQSATRGQSVDTRAVVTREISSIEQISGCQVVYIAGSATAVIELLKATGGRPVLTITEGEGLAHRGIIHFVVRDNRVRFEIDQQAAVKADLRISAKLLDLASNVKRASNSLP